MIHRGELHAYLDGELAAEEAARVEGALARDPELAAELEAWRGVDGALGLLEGAPPQAGFTDRVLVALRRAQRRGLMLRLALPLAAAAALTLAVILPGQWRSGDRGAVEEFRANEHLNYLWESDAETFGSLSIGELEEEILEGLDSA